MRNTLQLSFLALLLLTFASCSVVGDIFQAGMGFGIFLVIAVIVLILWLTVIVTGLGLFAPANTTSISIFLICALSAAGAVFLILELDEPFVGVIKASDAPLQLVLTRLGR